MVPVSEVNWVGGLLGGGLIGLSAMLLLLANGTCIWVRFSRFSWSCVVVDRSLVSSGKGFRYSHNDEEEKGLN